MSFLFYRIKTFSSLRVRSTSSLVCSLTTCIPSFFISLQDSAIFSAVSSLSPVNIQILTPAFCKDAIVSGTSSWRRSSTAVAPKRVRFYSKSSNNLFNLSSLLWISISDCLQLFKKSYASPSLTSLVAMRRVLRPYLDALSRKSEVASGNWGTFNLFSMIESAPFVRSLIWPNSFRTRTLILFLSEVNYIE